MNAKEVAEYSLRKNILSLPSGKFVTAGQNQFLTLWTRDFCHAVRGLIAIGEEDVVKNHLAFLLRSLRNDGLVPRVVDNHKVQFRVAWESMRSLFPFLPRLSLKDPVKPQYIDEHGSNAFDSNVLLILAVLQLDDAFFKTYEEALKKVWHWYDDKFKEGLIYQTPFADWQDTTKREGHTFLLNLFYFLAASRLKIKGWEIKINLQDYRQKIHETFFNGKVYLSQKGYDIVSVEGNLFTLEAPEFLNDEEKKSLWENLKTHPVITLDGVIGRCSYPDWPKEDLAWHIRLANLERYHGSITWSWLMGLGLKVCVLMDDSEMREKQLNHIKRLITPRGEVSELYDPSRDFRPWESWLISAEHPFAWGASYILEALEAM